MPLIRTKTAYELIARELATYKPDKFLESCLAQYLAVAFYAEMEERVSEIISGHLKRFTGSKIGQFLSANMEQIISRTPKSNIGKLLGQLGEDFKSKFNGMIDERDVAIYSNAIQARHNIGHKHGSDIDISEIPRAIECADKILYALDKCFMDE